jgi:hypothetical protein
VSSNDIYYPVERGGSLASPSKIKLLLYVVPVRRITVTQPVLELPNRLSVTKILARLFAVVPHKIEPLVRRTKTAAEHIVEAVEIQRPRYLEPCHRTEVAEELIKSPETTTINVVDLSHSQLRNTWVAA